MIEFHNTGIGRKFFEGTLPSLVNVLGRIASAMEKNLEYMKCSPDEDDPLVQQDNQYEAEYFEIDKMIMEDFADDYRLGEGSGMLLSQLVGLMLKELKARREGTFSQ